MENSKSAPTSPSATEIRDDKAGGSGAAPAHDVVPLARTVIPFSRGNYPRPQSGQGNDRSTAANSDKDDDPGPSAA